MKVFIGKLFYIILIPLLILFFLGLLIPQSPVEQKSLAYAQNDKFTMLQKTPKPRIIFVGGSNISFGLNCQIIKDSLKINPVNMGISAGVGFSYMMNTIIDYINEGDIVVAIPEYHHYYSSKDFLGNSLLLPIIFHVAPNTKSKISMNQWLHLLKYLPNFSFSKYKILNYILETDSSIGIYDRNSFNTFGDASIHWNMPKQNVKPYGPLSYIINKKAMDLIKQFEHKTLEKRATFFVSFPGYQDQSFNNSKKQIENIEKTLISNKFKILGTPMQYKMHDSLIFNTPYHLTKTGADYRTNQLIIDLKSAISGFGSSDNRI